MSKSKRKFKKGSQPLPGGKPGDTPADDYSAETAPGPPAKDGSKSGSKPPNAKGAKKKGELEKPIDPDEPHKYKRSLWLHLIRYPAAFCLLVLNVAMVMSFIERLPKHQLMNPFKETFFFGALVFIDLFLFVPIIFEVNRIETDKEGLRMSTLLWKTKLKWEQLIGFEQPKYLKFAFLRTKKTFYLLNKYHLKPFFELAEIISAKMPPSIEDKQA